jgi:uncharacterized Zn-finger protein
MLRDHIFKAHKTNNVKCPFCGKEYLTWNDFAIHILTTKEEKHEALLYFLLCEYERINANNGEFQVKNESRYKCPYCDKKFRKIVNLKYHLKQTHLKHNIYCPYCNEKFTNLHLFMNHLLLKNDDYHLNLYYLLSGKYTNFVNKKIFLVS